MEQNVDSLLTNFSDLPAYVTFTPLLKCTKIQKNVWKFVFPKGEIYILDLIGFGEYN